MNIHGHCPHCNANLDGDLIMNTAIEFFGYDKDEALAYASSYSGWDEYGPANRWSRKIGIYDRDRDGVRYYMCPDCQRTWERE